MQQHTQFSVVFDPILSHLFLLFGWGERPSLQVVMWPPSKGTCKCHFMPALDADLQHNKNATTKVKITMSPDLSLNHLEFGVMICVTSTSQVFLVLLKGWIPQDIIFCTLRPKMDKNWAFKEQEAHYCFANPWHPHCHPWWCRGLAKALTE